MTFVTDNYSFPLDRAAIDGDHILLPADLACLLPTRMELELGDGSKIKVARQEEMLAGNGLVKRLARAGNLLQWSCDGDRVQVRGLWVGGPQDDAGNASVGKGTPAGDFLPLLERCWRGDFCPPESFFLARELSDLLLKPGFDQLLSFQCAHGVDAYPYQVNTVRKVLGQMKGRALLCDEVGLGKTVEAALVMMEYLLRGLVKRVLILTPPSLVQQWREELAQKFGQDFVTSDSAEFAAPDAWARFPRIIASIDLAKRDKHAKQILGTRFDLVIVDEAHRLRHRNTVAWKLVNGLDKKYILLLTATPVQNDMDELFNLITLLRPGQLDTPAEFHKRFVAKGDRLKPINVERLRLQLGQVMIRNRRSSTGIRFTQRRAQTLRIEPAPEERQLYQAVTGIVRQLYTQDQPPINRFTLKTIQMELGSSPAAVASTVKHLCQDGLPSALRDEFAKVLDIAGNISRSAKLTALLKALPTLGNEKIVIFTRYLSTLDWLRENLSDYPLAVYHGGISAREKDESIERFRQDARILLSTDSGGEGRNLQFCHVMVNFDLPWNPMRIEQRIGRLSRIGQQRDVFVFNLSSQGTVEDRILDILDRKINLFELVVGELDLILGRLGEEKDFEEMIMDLVGKSRNDEELQEEVERMGEQLEEARGQYQQVKSLDDSIFGEVADDRQP